MRGRRGPVAKPLTRSQVNGWSSSIQGALGAVGGEDKVGRPSVPKQGVAMDWHVSQFPFWALPCYSSHMVTLSRHPPPWNPYQSWRLAHTTRPPFIVSTACLPVLLFAFAQRTGAASGARKSRTGRTATFPPVHGVLWTFCPCPAQGSVRNQARKRSRRLACSDSTGEARPIFPNAGDLR